jgi:purine-nucleoside phosphorylase
MLVSSLGSFFIKKELSETFGVITEKEKNNFLNFPSKGLNEIIQKSAMEENIALKQGVYWIGKGPGYETPAEIKMVGKFGIDAVGMSTAHEAIYAAMKGLDVSAISCITNYAAGITPEKLSHNDVMETAEKVKEKFERLVKRIIGNI